MEEAINLCKTLVKNLNLKLNGLTVITECASGNYAYTPIIAALAGAKVIAVGYDTSYGKFNANKKNILSIAEKLKIETQISVYPKDSFNLWSEGDIITNSGMLRPIEKDIITRFKKTAVIPLMWETWEFRKGEIDIVACQNKGIPVIGTRENFDPINMYQYPGMLALHILHKLSSDYSSDKIALLGGGLTGSLIMKTLSFFNSSIIWYANNVISDLEFKPKPYDQLKELLNEEHIDILLVAEHLYPSCLMGEGSDLNFTLLKRKFPLLKIGHLCGNIDKEGLKHAGIQVFPREIASFGYMSILPDMFGPKPILKLMSGGLKVGELAAKARLSGTSIEESIQKTIEHGIGQDFEGGFLNYIA